MSLLTSQKDTIYQEIVNSKFFTPNQFSLIETNTFRITYKNTNYFFSIHNNSFGQRIVSYSPAEDRPENTEFLQVWEEVLLKFDIWLRCLQRELQTPNYWETFSNQLSMINLSNDTTNEKFSAQEYRILVNQVEQLIHEVRTTSSLKDEQLSKIESDLKRVVVLAENLSKIDWKNLFIGT